MFISGLLYMLIKKDVLILGEGPTQGLHGATLTAEKNYSIYFDLSRKKIV